jgi:hypothetical protein
MERESEPDGCTFILSVIVVGVALVFVVSVLFTLAGR